jgi:hypothetical protein
MLNAAFAPQIGLKDSSRLPSLSRSAGITAAELACLLTCGALAALAVGVIHGSFGIPGVAILRGLLPIALGFAIVPRRSAGTAMSLVTCATAAFMNAGNVGEFQIPALVGTLALGPMLDTALTGNARGWHIYLRFAAAGAAANFFAFSTKFIAAYFGWHFPGSGRVTSFWSLALMSFIVCGALAGLISSAVWFRVRVNDDLRRN